MKRLQGYRFKLEPKHKPAKPVAKENRTTQDKFHCVACGQENNADVNAAINILKRGFEYLASTPATEKNRGTHGVSLSSEHHQMSAAGTNLTQPLKAA